MATPPATPFSLESVVKAVAQILSPRLAVAILLVFGFLLFVPTLPRDAAPLIQRYKLGIEFAFLVSAAVTVTYIGSWLWRVSGELIRQWLHRRRVRRRLHNLTLEEKYILQRYMESQSRTSYLKMNDGVVGSLVEAGIIYPAPISYARGSTFAYNISDIAWAYLVAHNELVATPENPKPKPTGNEWQRD